MKAARMALKILDEFRICEPAIGASWVVFDELKRAGHSDLEASQELKTTFAELKKSKIPKIASLLSAFAARAEERGYSGLARRCLLLAKEKCHYASSIYAKNLQQKIESGLELINKGVKSEKDIPEIK